MNIRTWNICQNHWESLEDGEKDPIFSSTVYVLFLNGPNILQIILRWKSQRIKPHRLAYRFSIDV